MDSMGTNGKKWKGSRNGCIYSPVLHCESQYPMVMPVFVFSVSLLYIGGSGSPSRNRSCHCTGVRSCDNTAKSESSSRGIVRVVAVLVYVVSTI